MVKRLLFAACVLVSGCGNDRTIHVRARADDTQKLEILAAADEWNKAIDVVDPGHGVGIVFDGGGSVGNDQLYFYHSDWEGLCSNTHQPAIVPKELGMEGQSLWIDLDCPIPFQDRVAHELGHYLGINSGGIDGQGHLPEGDGMMAPSSYGWGDVPNALSCDDIEAYCRANLCAGRRTSECR